MPKKPLKPAVSAATMGAYQEANMATKAEADKMLAKIRTAMAQIESLTEALCEAVEVFRDAAALIDAMADEMAELRHEA